MYRQENMFSCLTTQKEHNILKSNYTRENMRLFWCNCQTQEQVLESNNCTKRAQYSRVSLRKRAPCSRVQLLHKKSPIFSCLVEAKSPVYSIVRKIRLFMQKRLRLYHSFSKEPQKDSMFSYRIAQKSLTYSNVSDKDVRRTRGRKTGLFMQKRLTSHGFFSKEPNILVFDRTREPFIFYWRSQDIL